jgi:uncharacterized membrane protein YuzA (DUF378 family)
MTWLIQSLVTIGSLTNVYLMGSTNRKVRRWGCVLGAANQPGWVYLMLDTQQYIIACLCAVYFILWVHGFINNKRIADKKEGE